MRGLETHGTGCTLSAAVAAGLAKGRTLRAAVADAKNYVHRAMGGQFVWRRGRAATSALRHL